MAFARDPAGATTERRVSELERLEAEFDAWERQARADLLASGITRPGDLEYATRAYVRDRFPSGIDAAEERLAALQQSAGPQFAGLERVGRLIGRLRGFRSAV